jgi:uncharacterized YccA/Bax inhibitor family protein
MRTSNPALNDAVFARAATRPRTGAPSQAAGAMTVDGTVAKTGILVVLLLATALLAWNRFETDPDGAAGLAVLGGIGGLVVAVVTIFKQTWAPVTAPVYALLEGLLVGAVSARYDASYDGVVLQAGLLTAGTLAALLVAYRLRLIKVTENFRLGVVAATGGIMLVYVLNLVLGLFGASVPFLHDTGPIGILISLVIVAVAALNLVLDFDFIERGAERGAPGYMEWYAAFGLLVTLIWLYLELLRLLSKLRSR